MATIIKATGEHVEIGYRPTLEQLQNAVNGFIEIISESDKDVIVNEDYFSQEKIELNTEVSNMVGMCVFGDAVVCEKGEIK